MGLINILQNDGNWLDISSVDREDLFKLAIKQNFSDNPSIF
jgi:hypothetical protein